MPADRASPAHLPPTSHLDFGVSLKPWRLRFGDRSKASGAAASFAWPAQRATPVTQRLSHRGAIVIHRAAHAESRMTADVAPAPDSELAPAPDATSQGACSRSWLARGRADGTPAAPAQPADPDPRDPCLTRFPRPADGGRHPRRDHLGEPGSRTRRRPDHRHGHVRAVHPVLLDRIQGRTGPGVLDLQQWLLCTALALSIVVAAEIRKAALRRTCYDSRLRHKANSRADRETQNRHPSPGGRAPWHGSP